MEKTVEYTVNNRVSPATVELLIRERNQGKSLRQLGRVFGRSHERIRQVLAKYNAQVTLLPEKRVAAKLGYSPWRLAQLRKKGIIKPIRPGGFWLYSEEQIRQIPSLIAETRKCKQCGKLRPPGYRRFCKECSQYRKSYKNLSPEEKAEYGSAWHGGKQTLRGGKRYSSGHRKSTGLSALSVLLPEEGESIGA